MQPHGLLPAAMQLPALNKYALIFSFFLLIFLCRVLYLIVVQCLFTNNVLESSDSNGGEHDPESTVCYLEAGIIHIQGAMSPDFP
jgi:hypothetical protein